ncbi:hypothetical protein BDP27DRAFT_172387 [Rhodocollybia butyracea]|uniref:Uncharacterized protein n=1 Tax=Rhodocollybia butyracea TaxID=206335 RepID=A0A9P5U362_9AGAR|nr:hypothetical protein BDP27DRAFT_172387 [Rhodocollybia butyracea]
MNEADIKHSWTSYDYICQRKSVRRHVNPAPVYSVRYHEGKGKICLLKPQYPILEAYSFEIGGSLQLLWSLGLNHSHFFRCQDDFCAKLYWIPLALLRFPLHKPETTMYIRTFVLYLYMSNDRDWDWDDGRSSHRYWAGNSLRKEMPGTRNAHVYSINFKRPEKHDSNVQCNKTSLRVTLYTMVTTTTP